jgi:hypothetical protein
MPRQKKSTKAIDLYRDAELAVIAAGFGWEPEWQRRRAVDALCESEFLREAAWVVMCSGFRESVVRDVFDYVSLCFCDWETAQEITARRGACIETASARFANRRKLSALADIAELVQEEGFAAVSERLKRDPVRELQSFPFIGPVTSWHLAKNLGFNVAKNDRHLARLAASTGYGDAHELCEVIAQKTGELISVVDVVLWRFATLQSQPQLSLRFS